MLKKAFFSLVFLLAMSSVQAQSSAPADQTAPIKHIGIFVNPYYQSAQTPEGHPVVHVSQVFDSQLASNQREDILTVRDAIEAHPELVTPMTMMVLAIRLYDVGLRDDGVFWFYVAKNRYLAMAGVLNVRSPALSSIETTIRDFAVLAGPYFNSYAFCDLAKQRQASLNAITWIEQHPYVVMYMEQLPALPGDRIENLQKAIAGIKARTQTEAQYFDDPKNVEQFNRQRKERHVVEQFCWAQ